MEIIVRGQHFEVPGSVEERARRKLGRLDHYLPLLKDAVIEVDASRVRAKEPGERYLLRVVVRGNGVHLRAEERASALEAAVDQAARALTSQARRHKQRLYERGRPKGVPPKVRAAAPRAKRARPAGPKVVRVKQFAIKPMSVGEAMDEMQLLGHDFFVYRDADADNFAVLYRRRAGDYGVIIMEPS